MYHSAQCWCWWNIHSNKIKMKKQKVRNIIDPISLVTMLVTIVKIADEAEPIVSRWYNKWRKNRKQKSIEAFREVEVLKYIGLNGDRFSYTLKHLNGFWKAGYQSDSKGWFVDRLKNEVAVVAPSENEVKERLHDYLIAEGYLSGESQI